MGYAKEALDEPDRDWLEGLERGECIVCGGNTYAEEDDEGNFYTIEYDCETGGDRKYSGGGIHFYADNMDVSCDGQPYTGNIEDYL